MTVTKLFFIAIMLMPACFTNAQSTATTIIVKDSIKYSEIRCFEDNGLFYVGGRLSTGNLYLSDNYVSVFDTSLVKAYKSNAYKYLSGRASMAYFYSFNGNLILVFHNVDSHEFSSEGRWQVYVLTKRGEMLRKNYIKDSDFAGCTLIKNKLVFLARRHEPQRKDMETFCCYTLDSNFIFTLAGDFNNKDLRQSVFGYDANLALTSDTTLYLFSRTPSLSLDSHIVLGMRLNLFKINGDFNKLRTVDHFDVDRNIFLGDISIYNDEVYFITSKDSMGSYSSYLQIRNLKTKVEKKYYLGNRLFNLYIEKNLGLIYVLGSDLSLYGTLKNGKFVWNKLPVISGYIEISSAKFNKQSLDILFISKGKEPFWALNSLHIPFNIMD